MIYSYYQNTMGLQLIGCSYDKKSANVVMWKDKVYEYISSAWNNNNEELTILRLRNVSRKEYWTIVYGVGKGPLISIIYKRIYYNNNNNNNNLNNNNKIYLAPFPCSPMALYNQKRNRKVNLTCLWWTNMYIHGIQSFRTHGSFIPRLRRFVSTFD